MLLLVKHAPQSPRCYDSAKRGNVVRRMSGKGMGERANCLGWKFAGVVTTNLRLAFATNRAQFCRLEHTPFFNLACSGAWLVHGPCGLWVPTPFHRHDTGRQIQADR